MKSIKTLLGLILICLCSIAYANESFIIKKIEVQGNQRISQNTIISYLPIKVGDQYTTQKTNKIINALFATGFFDNVSLARSGTNTLVVIVEERPVISSITIIGNKDIPKDKLNEALAEMGFKQGETFNNTTFEQVKKALADQYYLMGRYNAKVTGTVKQEPRKRVAITINVSEGLIAKVNKISIIGNHVFSESTLLKELPLAKTGMLSFFSSTDLYSKEKLDQSIDALQSYYLNNGYVDMKVDSTQVTMTPDRKHVYIVFHVTEGKQYKFAGYELKGNIIRPEADFKKYINIKSGSVFSRQVIIDANKTITYLVGEEGYAFAKVNVVPKVDHDKHTVFITFEVDPGRRYYIRRINFIGNVSTSNIALRNMLTQFASSLYSTRKIEESKRNLRQLPYLKPDELSIDPVIVPDSNDQVDLDVTVAEQLSASFNFSVGYSQAFGFLITTGVTQNNFLGTGKTLGFNFSRSAFQTMYSINYFNPYFTYDGISRNMQVFYTDTSPGAVRIANYSTSAAGFNDSFGFPISNYQRFNLGYALQYTNLHTSGNSSTQIKNFVNTFGSVFYQILVNGGWTYNTLDRFQFPTRGMSQSLSANISLPVNGQNNLEYYTVSYQNRFFQPLFLGLILNTYGIVGYGDGYGRFPSLPFLQNFYAGGIGVPGQNRAYIPNTLGPLDSNGQPLGGNLLATANIGLIVPTPLERYMVRTTVFVDAGNVFTTKSNQFQPPNPARFDNIRLSAGVQLEWWTPLGMPLVFSLAAPINKKAGDLTQIFQFNIGGSF